MAATNMQIFSTGRARIGDVGGLLTDDANGVGFIQDFSVNPSHEEKAAYEAAWINQFRSVVAFHNGDLKVKLTVLDIERNLFVRIAGGALVTADDVDTITISKTSKPTFFRLEVDLEDTNGNAIMVVVPNAYAKDINLSTKIDDFGNLPLEISGLPDADGNVCIITAVTGG